jgi:hypothetical protein
MLSKKDQSIEYAIKRPKIVETFYKNGLIQDDGCIVWTAALNKAGYGRMCIKDIDILAHRFAWALAHGMDKLPLGISYESNGDRMVLNHLCHNRACVNINHLEVILQSQNTSKSKRKPRKPNDAIVADNLEDFMEQIRNTDYV